VALEIERKFLVKNQDFLKNLSGGASICQGYMAFEEGKIIRVRTKNEKAFLTIKSSISMVSKHEFEYEIPKADALFMLDKMCFKPLIEKTRYTHPYEGYTWEIDIFTGTFEGIVIAEIELEHPHAKFKKPDWLGAEVTENPDYHNALMVKKYNIISKAIKGNP